MQAKQVILCADDFAADARVNGAILHLAAAGRLSAVACFTDAPSWRHAGLELLRCTERVYLGLHFNLTQPFGRGERSLAYWIARCLSRTVDAVEVSAHLRRQWDNFTTVVGRRPDFIDGHQHVHAFPVLRSIVRDFLATPRQNEGVPVRAISPPFGSTDAPLKRSIIQALGRIGPQPAVHCPFNVGFAGDYSLKPHAEYERLFAGWLAGAPHRGLIMCHPGLAASSGGPTARQQEYRFLASARCVELLAAYDVTLARRPDRFDGAGRLTFKETGT